MDITGITGVAGADAGSLARKRTVPEKRYKQADGFIYLLTPETQLL